MLASLWEGRCLASLILLILFLSLKDAVFVFLARWLDPPVAFVMWCVYTSTVCLHNHSVY